MRIDPISYAAAYHVSANMREIDREEIFAARWNTDVDELAGDCMACAPMAWAAHADGEPVAVFGARPQHPGVWTVWLFATENWPKVAFGVTRFMKKAMFPAIVETGAHRIYCASLDKHVDAHRWLEKAFGARKEAVIPGFGRRRENFFTFAWTAENVRTQD